MTMALAAPATRKPDVRGQNAELRMELAAHRTSELVFIRRIKSDASVVIRLLVNEQITEACSVLGGLQHAATRRERQVLVDEDGVA